MRHTWSGLGFVHVQLADLLEWSEVGTEESWAGDMEETEPRSWENFSGDGRPLASGQPVVELLIVPEVIHRVPPWAKPPRSWEGGFLRPCPFAQREGKSVPPDIIQLKPQGTVGPVTFMSSCLDSSVLLSWGVLPCLPSLGKSHLFSKSHLSFPFSFFLLTVKHRHPNKTLVSES